MKLAYIRENEVFNQELLGLTIKDRVEKSLERMGFSVRFFNSELTPEIAEEYLLFLEPVLLVERNPCLKADMVLISRGEAVGYLFGRDFKDYIGGDLRKAIEEYLKGRKVDTQEVWAVRLNNGDIKSVEKELIKSLVKSEKTGLKPAYFDGIISRMLNRKISTRISAFLAGTGITPNQLTVLSFLLSLVASALFIINTRLSVVFAGILTQIHSIFDGCDGEIARLKFIESKYGAWLDGVLDRYADFAIIFSITYPLVQDNPSYMVLGFFGALATFMIPYTGDKYVAAFRETYKSEFEIPITRDVRLFIIFLFSLVDMLYVALAIIAVFGNLEVLRRIFYLRRKSIG